MRSKKQIAKKELHKMSSFYFPQEKNPKPLQGIFTFKNLSYIVYHRTTDSRYTKTIIKRPAGSLLRQVLLLFSSIPMALLFLQI